MGLPGVLGTFGQLWVTTKHSLAHEHVKHEDTDNQIWLYNMAAWQNVKHNLYKFGVGWDGSLISTFFNFYDILYTLLDIDTIFVCTVLFNEMLII